MTTLAGCQRCGEPREASIHHVGMPPHAFVAPPSRLPELRPRRAYYAYDVIQAPDASQECPRCGALLYESTSTGPACTQATCGWQSRYLRGTTHRADGSAITEGLRD